MVRVQKCWVLRVTDIKCLFCSSPLLWWCGPDLLQGDLSTALSRCKPWDTGVIVHLPPPEEGQFITCTFQTNYNTLVHSSPRRHWARLKNFSTWRFVANCVLGGYVLHHPASPPSFVFFLCSSLGSFTPVHFHTSPCSLVALFFCLPLRAVMWWQLTQPVV